MIRSFSLSILALCTSLGGASAAYFDLAEPVEGHPGVIYFDLVRQLVPDLAAGPDGFAVGHKANAYRHLVYGDYDTLPPETVQLLSVEAMPFRSEGNTYTLVEAELGQSQESVAQYAVLAAFDENLKLVDAVDVGMDRLNEIRGEPIPISPWDDAVLTYSEHFNSNQTYGQYALAFLRGGEFELIDSFGTLNDVWCGHERRQELSVTSTDAGDRYWPITVRMVDMLTVPDEDCGEDATPETPFERTVVVTYAFGARMNQYEADSNAFDAVAAENETRF